MVVLQDFSHLNEPKRGLAMTNKSQISMRSERLPTAGLSKLICFIIGIKNSNLKF